MTPPSVPLRAFILTVNGQRQMYLDFLDTRKEVLNWMAILAQAIVVISREDVATLTDIVHKRFPDEWFVISEIDQAKINGFISKQTWDFINHPRSSGRWE